jgi:hypothetical protein
MIYRRLKRRAFIAALVLLAAGVALRLYAAEYGTYHLAGFLAGLIDGPLFGAALLAMCRASYWLGRQDQAEETPWPALTTQA